EFGADHVAGVELPPQRQHLAGEWPWCSRHPGTTAQATSDPGSAKPSEIVKLEYRNPKSETSTKHE
ncbi:MAG TPA: hypothetical protein VM098_07705, partial [Phycisphaerae bacterium]|nr:hypothetical protein [Phycisphaerae bacterium]